MTRFFSTLVAVLIMLIASVKGAAAATASAHWAISTHDKSAQRLFDRGLMMLYAFDIAEARRLFREVATAEPRLAMAYWAMAEAETFDINLPSTPDGERRGASAIARAQRYLRQADPTGRSLIAALALRYAPGSLETKTKRYAAAMRSVTKNRRADANVLVITAFADWDALNSIVNWRGMMTAPARMVLRDLDRALFLDSNNIGAHHLRIHLLENAGHAGDAVSDATALESYDYRPGESHLLHMPAHVWTRLGRYTPLVRDNLRACDNDRWWFAHGDAAGQRYMRLYHDHVADFVVYGLTTVGLNAQARRFVAHEDASTQIKAALRLHEDERFTRFKVDSQFSALARALAATRLGHRDASADRQAFAAWGAHHRNDMDESLSRAGLATIDAAAAMRNGQFDRAAAAYRPAYDAAKNRYPGDPKDFWPFPLGEGYGAALLRAGRAAAAERVFRSELQRYPKDPHLELGLAEALAAQGLDDTRARVRYRELWKGTHDLTLDELG